MGGSPIPYSPQAEHVGVVRDPKLGNIPAIQARILAHSKALFAVLPAGLAKHHLGNLGAALRAHSVFATPVLLSGLASLVLSKRELGLLDAHHKSTIQRLLKLPSSTPRAAIFFLAGTLPASALIHQRQFGLLGMIARLGPSHLLHQHGLHTLLHSCKGSWFLQTRALASMYGLPDPAASLLSPQTKPAWKRAVKAAVLSYWRTKLSSEATLLPSLKYLMFPSLHLLHPHPIISSCGPSSYHTRAAITQVTMLAGQYSSCWHRRHWTQSDGSCQIPGCHGPPGNLPHILTGACPPLLPTVRQSTNTWLAAAASYPPLSTPLLSLLLGSPGAMVQALLNPSTDPILLPMLQDHPNLAPTVYKLARLWIWHIHKARITLLHLTHFLHQ